MKKVFPVVPCSTTAWTADKFASDWLRDAGGDADDGE